jgi:hypothetical protein
MKKFSDVFSIIIPRFMKSDISYSLISSRKQKRQANSSKINAKVLQLHTQEAHWHNNCVKLLSTTSIPNIGRRNTTKVKVSSYI